MRTGAGEKQNSIEMTTITGEGEELGRSWKSMIEWWPGKYSYQLDVLALLVTDPTWASGNQKYLNNPIKWPTYNICIYMCAISLVLIYVDIFLKFFGPPNEFWYFFGKFYWIWMNFLPTLWYLLNIKKLWPFLMKSTTKLVFFHLMIGHELNVMQNAQLAWPYTAIYQNQLKVMFASDCWWFVSKFIFKKNLI